MEDLDSLLAINADAKFRAKHNLEKMPQRFTDHCKRLIEKDMAVHSELVTYLNSHSEFDDLDNAAYEADKKENLLCQYCRIPATHYPESTFIHGNNYGPVYYCNKCFAYVSCKKDDPLIPLGTTANKYLRLKRKEAHVALDAFWKPLIETVGERESNNVFRTAVYKMLAIEMGIADARRCHIGWFTIDQCRKAISILRSTEFDLRMQSLGRLLVPIFFYEGDESDSIIAKYFHVNCEYIAESYIPDTNRGRSRKKRKSKGKKR